MKMILSTGRSGSNRTVIYVTGDCHQNFERFNNSIFPEQNEMTKDDYVIILGDFGGVWNKDKESNEETMLMDWLDCKTYTTLFIDGNHENFDRLYAYPVEVYHELGTENKRVILLIHPAVVMWDYFEYVIPLLEKDFHLVIPALPGYDPERKDDFTSIEEIAAELELWLKNKGIQEVECVYGCSMGGAIVAKLLSDNVIRFKHAVMDGGITPYQLPWLITRFIALRDFIMISMGKLGGIKLLEKAFSTDELSEEDIRYEAKVLKMISYKTIWRTFDSANNYAMPKHVVTDCPYIEYWVADAEEKDRKWDIAYIKKAFPNTRFVRFKNVGHGGLAPFNPEKLAKRIKKLCSK